MALLPAANIAELSMIKDWIRNGVSLDFSSMPSKIIYENTTTVIQNADIVKKRLEEYIDFQAIIALPSNHPCPYGIAPLHVIIKEGKKPRLVIDLSRNLNDNLVYEYFSYSNIIDASEASFPGCWYSKLDLSNCFLSFPLHSSALPHFIFKFDGQLYQFTRMPFGLSSAPRICTLLLSVVHYRLKSECSSYLRELIRYLDDLLFISPSRSASDRVLSLAQQVIRNFGLVVNRDKTEGPAQVISFLGIQINSIQCTLSCTFDRLSELLLLLHTASHLEKVKLSFLSSLIGKLSFAAIVLPGARPFMRRMLDLKHKHMQRLARSDRGIDSTTASTSSSIDHDRNRFRRSHTAFFINGFHSDISFWITHLHLWNGTQKWRSSRSAPICFATDASLGGFGFYIESVPADCNTSAWPPNMIVGSAFSGLYSQRHHHLHGSSSQMTWCEMFAVYAALSTYCHLLAHSSVLIYIDNRTDVDIINRQATRSSRLAGLLRHLYALSISHNFSIRAEHRAGVQNTLADFLSRPELHKHNHIHEWMNLSVSSDCALHVVSTVYSQDFALEQANSS